MDLFTLKDLNNWIIDVRNIIIGLNICVNNSNSILNMSKNPMLNTSKNAGMNTKHLGFLKQYLSQQKFIAVIELNKILSEKKGDKRSFKKLFNRLINQKYNLELEQWLENDTIIAGKLKSKKDIEKLIKKLKKTIADEFELIEKITNARDTFYAHHDENLDEIILTISEINKLTSMVKSVFNEITTNFFLSETWFDYSKDWSIDDILILMKNKD